MYTIALVGTVVLVAGCATSKGTVDSFMQSSYEQGSIDTIAIPRLRNASLAPSQAQQVTRRLTQSVQRKNPNVEIVTANSFNEFLNDRGLVDKYSDFLEDYSTSGIANREFTKHLVDAGIDGILIGVLSRVKQQDGSYGSNKGETRITLSFAVVDANRNTVIWSASADGIKGTATTLGEAPPIAQAVKLAMDKVEANLPKL
jgi:hypothetical protein